MKTKRIKRQERKKQARGKKHNGTIRHVQAEDGDAREDNLHAEVTHIRPRKDIEEMKQALRMRDSELKEVRTTFEKGKDRLVDQIIDLSDKFAEVNDVVAKVHTRTGGSSHLSSRKEHCLSTRTAERSASRTSADHL